MNRGADARPTRARQTVIAFTLALMGVAYLDRVSISTAAPAMQRDLALGDAQMAWVFSAFTLAYAIFEVPGGWLADRFGARLTLARIVLWWSAMTAATGAATGFASLVALRFLFGMGEAGLLPGISRAFGRWLPARERGRAFGLAIMAAAVAGALTQPLVVSILSVASWRHAFPIFGAVGLVWAAAWLRWFRDDPHEHPAVNAAERAWIGSEPPTPHPRVPWRALAKSRSLRALCAMYFCAIYGWYFYMTWLPTYLLRARGFDMREVGWVAAAPLAAIAAGSLAGGALADALSRRLGVRRGLRLPGLVGFPLAALAQLAAVATPSAPAAVALLAASAALGALGMAPAWTTCLAIGGRHAGVVSGTMNTFGNLGGVFSPLVVGFCLERWGAFDAPLYSIAALYLGAGLCWLGIDAERPLEVGAKGPVAL